MSGMLYDPIVRSLDEADTALKDAILGIEKSSMGSRAEMTTLLGYAVRLDRTVANHIDGRKELAMPDFIKAEDIEDKLLRLSGRVSCSAVRIYNMIRAVGCGELSADNALHKLVEDYHDLRILSEEIRLLSGVKKEGGQA